MVPFIWQNKKIIVADANQKSLRATIEVFESLGLTVVASASSGIDCLEKIKSHSPDLVCLDVIMPIMDGIECARVIEQNFKNIPFMFITKMTQDKMLIEALKSNFPSWMFLNKPLDLNQVHIRLNKIFPDSSKPSGPVIDKIQLQSEKKSA